MKAPDWENVALIGLAVVASGGGLVALHVGVPLDAVMTILGPVLMACGVAYKARM